MIKHPLFEILVMFLIISNIIIMGLETDDMSKNDFSLLEDLNAYFTYIFCFEAILKLFVFGPKNYFDNSWNK